MGEYVKGGPGGDSWNDSERSVFNDFLAVAFDSSTGSEVWAYQDNGRHPLEGWTYRGSPLAPAKLESAVYDPSNGLLIACGAVRGCLGYGCDTLFAEEESLLFTTIALDGLTGDLVWQRQVQNENNAEG